jgi:hypothetical protein
MTGNSFTLFYANVTVMLQWTAISIHRSHDAAADFRETRDVGLHLNHVSISGARARLTM